MIIKIFIFVFFNSFIILSQNPPILWQQNIGGSGNDFLGKIDIPGSTDYFLIGDSDSNISGDKTENSRGGNDIWIVKMNASHTILWDKTIGGDNYDALRSAIVSNGNLFLFTISNSSISGDKTVAPLNSDGTADIWLIKLDLDSTILWQKTYGGTANDGFLGQLIELPNGNLLLGTTSKSGISGNKTEANIGLNDFWLVEINPSDGSIINQNTIGTINNDNIRQLLLSPNNTILITGMAEQGISGDKTDIGYGYQDVWIVELDLSLNVLQDKCFGGTGSESDFGGSLIEINGFYYLITSSSSPISGNKTAAYFGSFDSFPRPDYWLLKLDTNFNIIWDKTFGGTANDNGGGIFPLSNNRLLITGNSETTINGNKTSPKYGGFDAWYIIIDTSGNIITQETYGGSLNDYIGASPTITNGVFYLYGGSESPISGVKLVGTNGGYDAWLMEIDASGFLNTEFIQGVNTTISVYPNPSNGVVNIKFSDLNEDVEIIFYTSDGREISKNSIHKNTAISQYNLNTSSSLLFYQIEGESINYSGKIILK